MAIIKRVASEEYADEKALYEALKAVENIPQSDWAQNDETAMDYVKNRTHWVETGAVEIHNDIISFSEYPYADVLSSGSTNYKYDGIKLTTHPNAGSLPSEINITIDGIKYICPLGGYISYTSDGALSEYKVVVGDNDYIACTATYRGYNTLIIFCTAGLINSQFLIEVDGDKYVTLDERFIPDTIARKSEISQVDLDSTLTVSGKAADAKATGDAIALKPGRVVKGETFTIDGIDVVAKDGAEIFNNLSDNKATGAYSHAEGYYTTASGYVSHAEGINTIASGSRSHAEGKGSIASGSISHAEGSSTIASGAGSHAEGYNTVALGDYSHAEGDFANALGDYSHAEGQGDCSLPDGITNTSTNDDIINAWKSTWFSLAKGKTSHTEGYSTLGLGDTSHTEGNRTIALGYGSHAEGYYTTASGNYSHAEGDYTTTNGKYSHAEGSNTIASGENSHVQGQYNIEDTANTYAHIVGNGDLTTRSNAHTLDWDGNAWYAGDVYVGSTSGTNKDDGSKKLATEEYVNEAISGVESEPVDLSNYVSKDDIIDIAHGGTNATDAVGALDNLGALNLGFITDDAHLIVENDDLNTYTTPGAYRCSSGAIAATLVNAMPRTDTGFRLIVSAQSSTYGVIQFVILNTKYTEFYVRTMTTTNTWGEWVQLFHSGNIDAIEAQVAYTAMMTDTLLEV